jgi:hypothetical protein
MSATATRYGSSAPASRDTREPSPGRSRLTRFVVLALGSGLLLTALVGVLHLPFAAPLLRKISPASLCPITRGSPEQIDRAHAIGAASIRASATTSAPSRPALGFMLDQATRSDVDAWAARHGVSCENIGGNANLRRCLDVPSVAVGEPAGFGTIEEVTFELHGTGELVSVETMRRHLSPALAAACASELERSAAGALGAPSTSAGEAAASHLGRGFLSSYVAEHAFTDYRATVTATNLGDTGVMVREQYLSAR